MCQLTVGRVLRTRAERTLFEIVRLRSDLRQGLLQDGDGLRQRGRLVLGRRLLLARQVLHLALLGSSGLQVGQALVQVLVVVRHDGRAALRDVSLAQ